LNVLVQDLLRLLGEILKIEVFSIHYTWIRDATSRTHGAVNATVSSEKNRETGLNKFHFDQRTLG
jgi:hypothetical protein